MMGHKICSNGEIQIIIPIMPPYLEHCVHVFAFVAVSVHFLMLMHILFPKFK